MYWSKWREVESRRRDSEHERERLHPHGVKQSNLPIPLHSPTPLLWAHTLTCKGSPQHEKSFSMVFNPHIITEA